MFSVSSRARFGRLRRNVVLVTALALLLALLGLAPASADPRVTASVSGSGASRIHAVVVAGGTLSGTVTGPGGPAAGVSVSASSTSGAMGYASSDPSGAYTISGLPTGSYRVSFNPFGQNLVPVYYQDATYLTAQLVPVVAGSAVTGIDALLAAGGAISGTVTGPNGPVAGATVSASSAGGNGQSASTDAAGVYTIRGLATGPYTVSFSAYGQNFVSEYYDDATYAAARPVPVVAGATVGGINAELARGAVISGTVTGADGLPVAGAGVSASRVGPVSGGGGVTTTGPDGTYSVAGLPAGSYAVQFSAPGGANLISEYYADATFDTALPVVVAAGATVPGINAQLAAGGSISGTVTGPDGNGVAGISVRGWGGSLTSRGTGVTAANGSYTLTGLPAGTYRVEFAVPAGINLVSEYYDAKTASDATPIAVAVGTTRSGIDARLAQGATISGTVTGPTGSPVAGSFVNAMSETGGFGYAQTGSDGTYTITGLRAGSYQVSFGSPSESGLVGEYYSNARTAAGATAVSTAAGTTRAGIDARLELGGSIRGTVRGPGASPVAGVAVQVYDRSQGAWLGSQTAPDGTYAVNGLVAGSYVVEFQPTNAQNLIPEFWRDAATEAAAEPVVVGLGGTRTGIDAGLIGGGSISGSVTRPAGVADLCVTAWPVGSAPAAASSANDCSDGAAYTLAGLTTGDYLVGFRANGAIPSYYDGVDHLRDATPIHVVQGAVTSSITGALVATGATRPTVTVSSSTPTPRVGQPVTFTVTVAGGAITPTGTVELWGMDGPAGEVDLINGVGALTTTFTNASEYAEIGASYTGDRVYAAAFGHLDFAVTGAAVVATSTTVTSSASPSLPGAPVTLSAVVTATTGTPTGEVTFRRGATVLGTASLASGRATLTTTDLPLGVTDVQADYLGSGTHAPSSGTASHLVAVAATTTSVVGSSPSSAPGTAVAFTATVASALAANGIPAGRVVFSNGATVLGTVDLVTGRGTLSTSALPAGAATVTAAYQGSSTHGASSGATSHSVTAPVVPAPPAGNPPTGGAAGGGPNETAVQRYIRHVYSDLFDRTVDPSGLATWTSAIERGTPRVAVANGITYSTEFRTSLIGGSYERYLARGPDSAGLKNWLAAMGAGLTVSQMESGFIASDEYYAKAGGNAGAWVTKLYKDVLDRDVGQVEVSFWTQRLAGGSSRAQVAMGFLLSTERLNTVVDGHYQHLLGRGLDPSGQRSWVGILQAGGRDEAIIGAIIASDEYFQHQ